MATRLPSYRLHKGSGQALVEWQGRRTYLGVYGSPESREAYRRFCARIVESPHLSLDIVPSEATVSELALAYLDHAQVYYATGGDQKSKEYQNFVLACQPLLKVAGDVLLQAFRVADLKLVRDAMVERGWSRPYTNHQVLRLRRMFKWGVEQEIVPPHVSEALAAVAPLRKGKTKAPETKPVTPARPQDVERVANELPPVLRAMVWLQRWSGMRSESLCSLRLADIDRTDRVWVYRPERHKGTWRGHALEVFLGPQAQRALLPLLDREPDDYLFQPREANAWRLARKREARQSKVPPSQVSRKKLHPERRPGQRFSVTSYRRAIVEVCRRLQSEGVDVETWTPHQLRHLRATEVRAEHGLEAAQVVLGHRHANVTQIYAERNSALARAIARASG